ncbi:MAG: hypothetical protein ACRCVI_01585 [Mycoplasmoidaceae bacterium]
MSRIGWPSKFYLKDIIEAQEWDLQELAIEAGIQIDELEQFLNETHESYVDQELDAKLCKATNQPLGYFLKIDEEYKKNNK